MTDDDELLRRLGAALSAPTPEAPPSRRAGVRDAALRARAERADAGPRGHGVSTSRRTLLLSTAAAAAVGATGGVLLDGNDNEPTAAPGPPTEALTFSASSVAVAGSTVAGRTINHTWGVELMLDATGFPVGEAYTVVYLDGSATAIPAGGYVGAELPIHCRCTAAILRADIAAIEIRGPGDVLVSRAEFT